MDRDIAIIGMAGRFPEAPDLDAFYRNLVQGRDSVRPISLRRKVNTGVPQDKEFQVLGFMEDIDVFDHDFFGMSAGEARYLDPHQRVLMETVYHAIENAGYAPGSLSGSRTAVFIGDTNQQYAHLSRTEDPMLEIGSLNATLAGRIARFFNLQGSALMVDTACSSSLVALHMAVNELLLGDAEQALVCGVSISLFQGEPGEDENGVMSHSGKSKTFSAEADGIGVGEATACVLLKPLSLAEADGDHIWAVIKSSAVNQDAGRSSSLSAPSWEAQSQVMQESWRKAGIDPGQIGFIEAHGTGTKLGDPIEIQAITDALSKHTARRQFCAISSAKANIGHADTAAGITGLFRAVLSLRYKTLFPAVHFEEPNPFIDFTNSPVFVPHETTKWKAESKRLAGVSSFGVSGTNCHVVLEEAYDSATAEPSGHYPFVLSAKTEDSLTGAIQKFQHYLRQHPDTNLADLSHTLCTGRDLYAHRVFISAGSVEELVNELYDAKTVAVSAPDNVWMVCSPEQQVSEEDFRKLTGTSGAFGEIHEAYIKYSDKPESKRWLSVLYSVALYHLLQQSGMASRNLMGLAEGKLAVSIIKGEKTCDEAFQALTALHAEGTPEPELKKKLSAFTTQKLTGHSLVIELGPEGVLSRLLKELNEENRASCEVLVAGTSLETIRTMVSKAGQAGMRPDWKPLFTDKTYCKLPLPGYAFGPVRCWLDDSAQVFYQSPSPWAYERVLKEKPLEDADADSPLKGRRYLFVSDEDSTELVNELALSCTSYVHVRWGQGFERLSEQEFILRQTGEGDFARLMEHFADEKEALQGIVLFHQNLHDSEKALQLTFAQALLIKEFNDYLRQPDFHVANVRVGKGQSPGQHTMTHSGQALSRSLLSDFIGLNVHDITCNETNDKATLAAMLQNEFASTEVIRFVTLQGGKRYVEKLQKAPAEWSEGPLWEPAKGNSYLVAGGAKGAAFEVMKQIAARTPSEFIILGRSAIDEAESLDERAGNIKLLKDYGSTVHYIQADVACEQQMNRIGEELAVRYGQIDYVINAAGTSPRLEWDKLNLGTLREHTEAKTTGTRLLHMIAGKLKARRYVLFSSLNTLFPDRHSFTYSLACAWQDGYALNHKADNVTAINWGIWAATNVHLADGDHESPILPFASHIAKKGVDLALTWDLGNFIFADLVLDRISLNPFYLVEEEAGGHVTVQIIPEQTTDDLNSAEEKLLAIWTDVLRNPSLTTGDNFFHVGGHSLIAIRIINLIRKAFGVSIEFRHMLEYPTVSKLAIFIQGLTDTSRSSGYTGIAPAAAAADYPLSHAQKRLWILDQMENMGHTYVIPRAYTFRGRVNTEALEKSFRAMVHRHESFRTTFRVRNEEPRQVIHSDAGAFTDFQVIDLRNTSRAEHKSREMATEEAAQTFDLENGPLLRGRLLLLDKHTFVFIYTMHHIISDEWSLNVFRNELITLYQGYAGGEMDELADLQVQYKDFAVWQNDLLRDTDDTHKSYWLQQFSGSLPVLQLPTDYPRPARLTFSGDAMAVAPDQELLDRLTAYGQRHELSLFMILMSAIKVLFYRYTGQKDLILGTPVAGRDHDELEEQIGYYVNTLAIRSQINPEATFEQIAQEVRENILQAFEHQVYPFDKIVEDLQPATPAGHRPLFDTMVLLQNAEVAEQEGSALYGGVEVENFSFGKDVSKFDITFEFTEHPTGLSLYIEYNSDLFRKERIEHMAAHLYQLLNEVATGTENAITEINILSEDEKSRLISTEGAVATYPESETIVSLFEKQATNRPKDTAVIFEDKTLTFGQLNEQANQVANYLRNNYNLKPDDRVGIMMPRGMGMVVSIMGILKAGAAYLPIDPGYPVERRQFMAEDAAPIVILTGDVDDSMSVPDIPMVAIDAEAILNASSVSPALETDPDDLAYIIYTSGSTGKPKGVMIGHRQVVRLLFSEEYPFRFSEDDTWITLHSISFDFSVWEIFGPLLTGGRLVVATHENMRSPADVLTLLQRHQVTVLNQTPTVFSRLTSEILSQSEKPDLKLRYVIFGGEALNPATLHGFHKAYPDTKLVNMYGITETTVHVTYKEIGEKEIAKGSSNIGRPLPTLGVLILDEGGQIAPQGVAGEIAVEGAGLARGYLNRETLTAERFVSHPFREGEKIYLSGDLGMCGFDGDLYYFGRKDKQVKIRGYRIELGEIEHSLLQHNKVDQALVTVREDDEGRKQLVAYCKSTVALTYAGLKRHLRSFLPDYMVPAYFVQVEEIHFNGNGKADTDRLPDPLTAGLQNDEYVAPQNPVEDQLLTVFAEVLNHEHLGTRHNFFAAGGDSIKAIRLAGRINKVTGRNVAVKDIYLYPDTASLAAYLENRVESTKGNSDTGYQQVEEIKNSILADPEQSARLPKGWQDFYPMSAVEKGMLFYNQLYEGQYVFHDQFFYSFSLQGFDIHLFERAFVLLIDRHDILRTSFHTSGYIHPVQVVHPSDHVKSRIITEYVKEGDETVLKDFFEKVLEQDRKNPFTPEEPGLWRMRLFILPGDRFVLLWIFHHAIMDGWSNASLMTELLETYDELAHTPEFTPEPLAVTYKDYVAGELEALTSAETRRFWEDKLRSVEKSALPFDRAADSSMMQEGLNHYRFVLADDTGKGLLELAAGQGTGVREVLIGAFLYFLRFTTTGRDLVIGLIGNGRPEREDGDKVMGCFLNSLPLRVDMNEADTGKKLTDMVKGKTVAMKPHEKFPLLEMIALTDATAGQGGNAFFDIVFNYVDFHVYGQADTQLEESGLDLENHEVADTPFDLTIRREGDALHCQFAYPKALYTTDEVARLSRYFTRIADRIASEPEKELLAQDLLDYDEQKELNALNDTTVEYDDNLSVTDLFELQAFGRPGVTALICRHHEVTFGELYEQVNQLAQYLIHVAEVKTGDVVAFAYKDNQAAVTAIWAIMKAGGAYLPLATDTPADRLGAIIREARPVALLTDQENIKVAGTKVVNTQTEKDQILSQSRSKPAKNHTENDPAYVIFTSGSTGIPKGVLVSHGSLVNMALDHIRVHQIKAKDRMLQFASFTFDASLVELMMAQLSGAALVLTDKELIESPDALANYMEDKGVTFVSMPVSYFNLMPLGKVPTLRAVLAGGEAADVEIASRASEQLRYWNAYGPTECSVITSRYEVQPEDRHRKSMPIGKPVSNTRVYLLDDSLQLTSKGLLGELCVAGTGLALGYLNDEKLTAQKFTESPYLPGEKLYRTGDYARLLPDGNIEFAGRKDSQVKVNGYRIETGEIVKALMQHDQVRQAVVNVQAPSKGVKYLSAWVVSKKKHLSARELKGFIGNRLPSYMVPASIMVVEEIPLTSHGKVDFKELKNVKADIDNDEQTTADALPANELESGLLIIWRNLFGNGALNVTDNFFAAGGNSISALQMISRVGEELGIQVPVKLAFEYPTIHDLAGQLLKEPTDRLPAIEKLAEQPYYEASRAQWRFWTMDQMSPGSLNYVINNVYHIHGELQHEALEKAARQLIERHEVLRTGLSLKGGKLVQNVQSVGKVVFGIERYEAENGREGAYTLLNELAARPFVLKEPPLFRISRVDLADDKCLLLVSLHHVITDGWSMVVLMRELTTLYEKAVQEEDHNLSELGIQYKDYAMWHNSLLQSTIMQKQKAYWKKAFEGFTYRENNLAGKERAADTGMNGERLKFRFGTQLMGRFTEFCRRQSVTPFMTALAALNTLNKAFTGQKDTVIGTSVTGRNRRVLENQIGCYLNNLAIRTVQEEGETFASLLKQTEEACRGAYANDQYPFDMLVNDLDVSVLPNRFPLMDIALLWDNDSEAIAGMSPAGLEIEEVSAGPVISNMDLRFIFSEQEGSLALTVEYKTDLFDKEHIERLFSHLKYILEEVIHNPQIRISHFDTASLASLHNEEADLTDIDTQFNF